MFSPSIEGVRRNHVPSLRPALVTTRALRFFVMFAAVLVTRPFRRRARDGSHAAPSHADHGWPGWRDCGRDGIGPDHRRERRRRRRVDDGNQLDACRPGSTASSQAAARRPASTAVGGVVERRERVRRSARSPTVVGSVSQPPGCDSARGGEHGRQGGSASSPRRSAPSRRPRRRRRRDDRDSSRYRAPCSCRERGHDGRDAGRGPDDQDR